MSPENFEIAKKYFGFLISTREKFIENYKEEIKGLFNYVITLMSVMGLIAGFGFTAYSYIRHLSLFFIGEIGIIFSGPDPKICTPILYIINNINNIQAYENTQNSS